MFSEKIHRHIYIFSLILLGIGIPLSVFLMSVSQFLLATNWLLELNFKNKWLRLKQNKAAIYLIGLFFLHLLWMINSNNWTYGLHDIKIKLPLLVLAILIGSSEKLHFSEIKLILNFFISSVLISTIISGLIYYDIIHREITDTRQISIFISHIRLSLLVNIAFFSSLYLFSKAEKTLKALYIINLLWFPFFLFILNSYTGLFIFIFVLTVTLMRYIFQSNQLWIKKASVLTLIILFVSGIYVIYDSYKRFSITDQFPQENQLEKYSLNGNPYRHHTEARQTENGHFIHIYICNKELEKEWDKRSKISFKTGLNKKGELVRFTLLNYLSSLNLKKDSIGMAQLSDEDIKLIEAGYTNYIYKNKYSIYAKIYPILKQIKSYNNYSYAEGASISQRFEYLKIATRIIKDNFWFGVGTGDVDDTFKKHYANGESSLSEEYQHRAHNQYLTFFISFGIFGFIASLFFMFTPVFYEKKQFLPLIFSLIAFLSMLNEDTLETQAGITFFTYFYSLFFVAFSFKKEKNYLNHPKTKPIENSGVL